MWTDLPGSWILGVTDVNKTKQNKTQSQTTEQAQGAYSLAL